MLSERGSAACSVYHIVRSAFRTDQTLLVGGGSLGDSEVYYMSRTATDMRKGFDALCGEVRRGMGRDPISGEVFILYNSNRTRLKLLHWERGGFAIYHKRFERGILTLPLPRTNAGPSLLAQLLVGKYQDHLPLHRQIGILARAGIQLKASTVSDWVQGAAELLESLYECLRRRVLGCDYIQVDGSIILVLDKDKPGATCKGYHWVVRSPELNSLFFHNDKGSRAQYVAVELLKDFQGAVQSDGYGAYDIYENKYSVLLLGCWAHARRKFEHALTDDPQRAEYALRVIGQLYAIERRMKEQGLPPNEVKVIRERVLSAH